MALATATVLLLARNGFVGASAGEGELPSATSPMRLVCGYYPSEMTFIANGSWQAVSINGMDQQFNGACNVKVNFAATGAEGESTAHLERQLTVLVHVYALQLLPSGSTCWYYNLILEIQDPTTNARGPDICNDFFDALYIWVRKPFRLHMYAWRWSVPWASGTRASFSVAFAAVQSVNVCHITDGTSASLKIDSELYAYVPDSKFSDFLPNSAADCTSNSELTLAATSPLNSLNVTVLTAPANLSCWSLSLDGYRIVNTESRIFTPGKVVSLSYALNVSQNGCKSNERQRGFTIRFISVPAAAIASTVITAVPAASTSLPIGDELVGTSLVAVAAGSAAAAVAVTVVVAIAVALLVNRRRSIKRLNNSVNAASQQATNSVLGPREIDSAIRVHPEQSDHLYDVPSAQQQFQPAARFSTISSAAAPTADVFQVTMVDNNLYGSAFGGNDAFG